MIFQLGISREPEIKKLLLDQSFRHYLTEELLCDSKEVKLEDCEALVTISILGMLWSSQRVCKLN